MNSKGFWYAHRKYSPITRPDGWSSAVRQFARARSLGIAVRAEWIANHKVDKRHYRRVKFQSKDAVRMPRTVIFIFANAREQLAFKLAFG